MAKKMALGRGLGALIEDAETPQKRAEAREIREGQETNDSIQEIDINKIEANPFQPRTTFDEETLHELSESIKKLGIIQPLTVRKVDGKYQLISGERRLRAAKMAGLKTIPAFIRTANDQGMLEMALVENIQRENLDAIEIAISYQRLIDECKLTHDNLSDRVGKKRATVTNYLRLLKLPGEIQIGLKERKLGMGHARAILSVEDKEKQIDLYHTITENELSVRKTEELAKLLSEPMQPASKKKDPKTASEVTPELAELEQKLQNIFGWGVEVKPGKKGSGRIVINYRTAGELDELMEKVNRFGSK
ncbi:MAG: ParB/RepB/Spo0J family partition protein [Bacteroidales bacterium]|nr:ParB/RepB/Spo0J family partition protein [Bacteroidales bacterium]MDY0348088.1 ParB/RepB/Spo0J family partition protein [Tenuifilaceae bacterium]